jgi:hypothetical protein
LKKLHSIVPMVVAATILQIAGDFRHGRSREVGKRKRTGRGFDSIPNLPRGRIVEIEFRGGSRSGGSVLFQAILLLFLAVLLLFVLSWTAAAGGRQGEGQRRGSGQAAYRGRGARVGAAHRGRGDTAALFLWCWAHRRCMAAAVQGRLAKGAHGQGEGLARLVQQLLLAAPRGSGGLGWAWRRRRMG